MINKIITEGTANCILEPRGESGLEGYVRGRPYKFQHCSSDKNGKQYYRVYPDPSSPNYYETCGPTIFKHFFKAI